MSDSKVRARAVPILAFFKEDLKDGKYVRRASSVAGTDLRRFFKLKDFNGAKGSHFEILRPDAARPRAIVCGFGKREKAEHHVLYKTALKLFGHLKARPAPQLALMINLAPLSAETARDTLAALIDAANFSSFSFEKYIKKPKKKGIAGLQVLLESTTGSTEIKRLLRERSIYGDAVNIARSLIVEPGGELPPLKLAERMADHLKGTGVKVKIHTQRAIEKLNLKGILTVGRGSEHEPRFVEMTWEGAPGSERWLGLVGKGVTFDTGGISLKKPQGMWKMKYDMSGSAAVLGAMISLAALEAPVNVRAVTPLIENMPGGNSYLPGDVITYDNGLSVEIMSTDAEGRLILADGIMYLSRRPEIERVVSIATLTGAVTVSLGREIAGAFSRHDGAIEDLKTASARSGELAWPLPMHEPYGELLKSDCADMKNGGDGTAGSIVAAMMLDRFSEDAELLHLDIAGVAWMFSSGQPGTGDSTPRGAGVRLLAEFARGFGGNVD